MQEAPIKHSISIQEAEEHYQLSSKNYTIESGESHLAYYREKYARYYHILLENI